MNGNSISSISHENPLKVLRYTPDQTSPFLVNFIADLNNSKIIFSFSETVNATSLVPSQITLLSMRSGNFSFVSIQLDDTLPFPQGSFTPSVNDNTLEIFLGSIDMNKIKQLTDTFTSVSNSFLSISSIAIEDMNGNYILAILTDNAIQVNYLYFSRTPPIGAVGPEFLVVIFFKIDPADRALHQRFVLLSSHILLLIRTVGAHYRSIVYLLISPNSLKLDCENVLLLNRKSYVVSRVVILPYIKYL